MMGVLMRMLPRRKRERRWLIYMFQGFVLEPYSLPKEAREGSRSSLRRKLILHSQSLDGDL